LRSALTSRRRSSEFPPTTFSSTALALPISTGIEEDRRNALETIEAIRRIKTELPGAFSILGVSNVSFGLNPASRVVLNSVFLHEAVAAGLDSAIVNASKIEPLNRIEEGRLKVALDLIYDRREFDGDVCTYDPLVEFTKLFEGVTTKSKKRESRGETIEEKLKFHIIDGEKLGLEANLKVGARKVFCARHHQQHSAGRNESCRANYSAAGRCSFRSCLQSAEANENLRCASSSLSWKERAAPPPKGRWFLPLCKGDVHDIGKNLVDIILTNNGYRVINLGIKQTIDTILNSYEEHQADAIGMSGLLVKSTLIMKENLEVMNERNIKVPVVLGGAALTRRYVEDDLKTLYKGTLFYARDAFAGLHTMDKLMSSNGDDAERRIRGRFAGYQRDG
jgi:5-methyltetrahydrofolate--homocysteine methyltransferase